jgi:hypothetical protein
VFVPRDAEGYDDKYTFGRRANGVYVPRYRNFCDKRDYVRGSVIREVESRWLGKRNIEFNIGGEYKDALLEPGWTFAWGFCEILPYHENKVTLNKDKKDKWGLNILDFDCELKENELKMRKDMKNDAQEMLEAAGLKNVQAFDGDGTPVVVSMKWELRVWVRIQRHLY